MTFKKKLAVTTIAASLVTGSLAGLPLSSKGLAEQLGFVQVAAAATPTPTYSDVIARLDRIHTALIAGGEAQKVRDLRDLIGALDYATANAKLAPLLAYVPSEFADDEEFKEALFTIFQSIGTITYSADGAGITAVRTSPEVDAALDKLVAVTGVERLTVDDLLAYGSAVETAAVKQLKAPGKLATLAAQLYTGNTAGAVELFKAAANEVLSSDDLKVNQLIEWFAEWNTTPREELVDAVTSTIEGFTTDYPGQTEVVKEATKALAVAFIRAETTSSVETSNNGRTQTFSLSLLKDIKIPADLLTWTVTGDDNISLDDEEAGVVNLADTASTGTATLEASVLGKVIFSDEITLNYNAGGGVFFPPANPVFNALLDLKNKIANATGAEKEKLIKEAIAKALEAINAISTIDVSGSVVVVDGKATVTVNSGAVSKVANDIAAIIAALKDAAPGAEKQLPNINVTFQAGKVESKDITFNVDADGVKSVTAAGLYGTKFAVNGFSANLPVSQAKNSKVGFNVKNSTPAANTLKAVSDSYDFNLSVDGTAVHQFSQPVEISFPVTLPAGVDKDLLSVYDGTTFYGGVYNNGVITENRDHFSSYVVVENKVAFNDISKVKAWAGRQIEVMAAKGAIQGRAKGAFVPNGEVTRAEFAKMLVQALDLDNVLAKEGFSDVNATDWFAPYVAAASEAGIIKGRTATSFAPKATITRAEMAVMVARALEATKGVKASADDLKALEAFKDAGAINASLKDGVAFAANNGLVVGDKGKFNPNATATRAQAAVIIYRAFNFKG